MPTGTLHRLLRVGLAPSREGLFDSLKLGLTVKVSLVPSNQPLDELQVGVERYVHHQIRFSACRVTLIGDTRDFSAPWLVHLVHEPMIGGVAARLTMSFNYSTDDRYSPEGVTIRWTTERCRDTEGGGCGELLWPDEETVCQYYPDCCRP